MSGDRLGLARWVAAAAVVVCGTVLAWRYQVLVERHEVQDEGAVELPQLLQPPQPGPTPVEPSLETGADAEAVLSSLRGRPVVVLMWTPLDPSSASLLAAVDAACWGTDVSPIGVVPHAASADQVAALCRAYGIRWTQHLGARAGTAWPTALGTGASSPQLVVIDREGVVVATGRPRAETWATLSAVKSRGRVLPMREVRGEITWAGHPLSELEQDRPRLWFRDETRMVHAPLDVAYHEETATFTVLDVAPGCYGVSVHVGRPTRAPEQAYTAWTVFGVPVEAAVPLVSVELTRALHLREPLDSAIEIAGSGLLRHPSPVVFRWDPLPPADRYLARVRRLALESDGPGSGEEVFFESLSTTRVELDLEGGWLYVVTVDAYAGDSLIGRLMGGGSPWAGASYRFLVGT